MRRPGRDDADAGPRPGEHAGTRARPGRIVQRRATRGREMAGAGSAPAPWRKSLLVTLTVVLVDDQPLVRAGFRTILESAADIQVLGEAGDGSEGVTLVRATRPDVVLMDVRMPHVNGIEATRRI